MSDDFAGGAAAPAESNAAPIPSEAPAHTNALGSQTPNPERPQEPVEAKPAKPVEKPSDKAEGPSKTAGDAIRRAQEKLAAKEAEQAKTKPEAKAEPKAEPKPDNKSEGPERARAEDGKFASQKPAEPQQAQPQAAPDPAKPRFEAPSRFSPDAKAAWETAPDAVKAEATRAIRELEEGHRKYKASHEAYQEVRQFDEIARKNGGNLKASLEKVVDIETAFSRNPIEGFQKVADHFGIDMRAVAAHVLGRSPQEVQSEQDTTIRQLKSQVERLTQELGGVTKTFQEQRTTEVLSQVEAFAKDHPRFDELSDDIGFFLENKRASTLLEAYEMAERLNPAPSSASAYQPVSQAPLQPAPLSPAGQKSITGAPASGSDPVTKKAPASSTRQALERALARAGSI